MNQKYQFYNPKASSVRSILVANCVDCITPSPVLDNEEIQPSSSRYVNVQSSSSGNPPSTSHNKLHHYNLPSEADLININSRGFKGTLQGAFQNWKPLNNIADINYTSEFHAGQQQKDSNASTNRLRENENVSGSSPKRFKNEEDDENVMDDVQVETAGTDNDSSDSDTLTDNDDEMEEGNISSIKKVLDRSAPVECETDPIIDPREKWLIFTHGTKTYTPHMIGFKRIKPFKFKSLMSPGPSVHERHLELKRRRELQEAGHVEPRIDYTNYDQVADLFDSIDHVIELHGKTSLISFNSIQIQIKVILK